MPGFAPELHLGKTPTLSLWTHAGDGGIEAADISLAYVFELNLVKQNAAILGVLCTVLSSDVSIVGNLKAVKRFAASGREQTIVGQSIN